MKCKIIRDLPGREGIRLFNDSDGFTFAWKCFKCNTYVKDASKGCSKCKGEVNVSIDAKKYI